MLVIPSRNLLTLLILTICLICLAPARTLAWGSSGHRLIAALAWDDLNKTARGQVEKLLGKDDFVSVSTYADEARSFRPETTRWHLVEFPRNATAYVWSRDCAEGDCVLFAIKFMTLILRTEKSTTEAKSEALKMLVHLMGDLHQPLHCGYKDDRGGNTIKVLFPNSRSVTNLHVAWDSLMIERALAGRNESELKYKQYLELSYGALTETVERQMRTHKAPEDGISDWAFESYCIAVRSAYNLDGKSAVEKACQTARDVGRKPVKKLTTTGHHAIANLSIGKKPPSTTDISGTYYKTNLPVLEQQLVTAGIRLAGILNSIYPEKG